MRRRKLWQLINCRFCSQQAIRIARRQHRTGDRSAHAVEVIKKRLLISDRNPCPIRIRWIERVAGKAGRIMTPNAPEIIDVNSQQFEELLERAASNTLRDEDLELMRSLFASYAGFFQIVGDKNTTIARLRKMMFGATSETSQNVCIGHGSNQLPGDALNGDAPDDAAGNHEDEEPSTPGHGRYSAGDYPGADQVDVSNPELSPGDTCPECTQGTLYEKPPGVLVRFVGQAPLHATVYRRQKLRCHLCGKLFTARFPPASVTASTITRWPA